MSPNDRIFRPTWVVTLDAVNASYLGPYGNTWLPTPGWNQWAAHSLLCEQALTPSTELQESFRDCWRIASGDSPTLANLLAQYDVPCRLLTDEPLVAELADSSGFGQVSELPKSPVLAAAEDLEATRMCLQMDKVVEYLQRTTFGGLTWVHLAALQGPWDAPREMRLALFDEELGEPPDWIDPELVSTGPELESDELLRWQVAYGAQIQVLDFSLQYLFRAVESLSASTDRPPIVLLAAPRGYHVGGPDHSRITGPLWTANVQIPLMISGLPDSRCLRNQQLTSWSDIGSTLLDLAGVPRSAADAERSLLELAEHPGLAGRDRMLIRSRLESAVRTEQWFLRCPAAGSTELYVKPDDRHDVNEVSQRLPYVTEQLLAVHAELLEIAGQPQAHPLESIPVMPND